MREPEIIREGNKLIINISDSVTVHDDVSIKAFNKKPTGGKNVFYKAKIGMEFHKLSGTWQFRYRTVNYRDNWYSEFIHNETLNFIKKVEEDLRDHQGHGSSKNGRGPLNHS
jgi:hypothetical protein